MHTAHVEKIYSDLKSLDEVLSIVGEPSLLVAAQDYVRKTLLLASASAFEKGLCQMIDGFFRRKAWETSAGCAFVKNKAIARQYHTYFDWKDKRIAPFFGLFGDDFKIIALARYRADSSFKDAADAFLEIGAERNRLVHEDFASYSLEMTAAEIHEKLLLGSKFVDMFERMLWVDDRPLPKPPTRRRFPKRNVRVEVRSRRNRRSNRTI